MNNKINDLDIFYFLNNLIKIINKIRG